MAVGPTQLFFRPSTFIVCLNLLSLAALHSSITLFTDSTQ